jgi:hypothetical protein
MEERIQKLGPFECPETVYNLLQLYAYPGANPYIPLHLWGVEPETKTVEQFIEEVISGETTLSLEHHESSIKLVRDIGATLTMRITCVATPDSKGWFLQQYRRGENGIERKRRHRHTSLSEKQKKAEREALRIHHIPNDDWVSWWNDICARYVRGQLMLWEKEALFASIKRMLGDELGIFPTDEDLCPERLKLISIDDWKLMDTELQTLHPDGTNESGSFLGIFTRNRLMCIIYDMPACSSNGTPLLKPEGHNEPATHHAWRWITGHRND